MIKPRLGQRVRLFNHDKPYGVVVGYSSDGRSGRYRIVTEACKLVDRDDILHLYEEEIDYDFLLTHSHPTVREVGLHLLEKRKMYLWVDDIRPRPDEFSLWAKTATEAIDYLERCLITHISLDHDLGNDEDGTGYDIAKYIEERAYNDTIHRIKWSIHSANPVGCDNMRRALENADRYWDQHSLTQYRFVSQGKYAKRTTHRNCN